MTESEERWRQQFSHAQSEHQAEMQRAEDKLKALQGKLQVSA